MAYTRIRARLISLARIHSVMSLTICFGVRSPIEQSGHLRMIGHVLGNIDWTSWRVFGNGHLSPNDFLTEPREFLQRTRSTAAPAHVEGAIPSTAQRRRLRSPKPRFRALHQDCRRFHTTRMICIMLKRLVANPSKPKLVGSDLSSTTQRADECSPTIRNTLNNNTFSRPDSESSLRVPVPMT